MLELNIDYKNKDFNFDKMIEKFKFMAEKHENFQERDRYKHLLTIVGEHKFWE